MGLERLSRNNYFPWSIKLIHLYSDELIHNSTTINRYLINFVDDELIEEVFEKIKLNE